MSSKAKSELKCNKKAVSSKIVESFQVQKASFAYRAGTARGRLGLSGWEEEKMQHHEVNFPLLFPHSYFHFMYT